MISIVTQKNKPLAQTTNASVIITSTDPKDEVYADASGKRTIKDSVDNIYHIPSSTYYNKAAKVKQWFKTISLTYSVEWWLI